MLAMKGSPANDDTQIYHLNSTFISQRNLIIKMIMVTIERSNCYFTYTEKSYK